MGQEKFGTDPCNFCVLIDRGKTCLKPKAPDLLSSLGHWASIFLSMTTLKSLQRVEGA